MKKLLIGFDSAWTRHKQGALAGAFVDANRRFQFAKMPVNVDFPQATAVITDLQKEHKPDQTVIFLDQPHIVANPSGARPVERIVTSIVSRRYGGMQTAATETPESKSLMFGTQAPVWNFLNTFGGPANPYTGLQKDVLIFETYPVLYLIANEWLRPDKRPGGKLPKYNPERRKTFGLEDWVYLCDAAKKLATDLNVKDVADWFDQAGKIGKPNKAAQDQLDAMLCLLQSIEWEQASDFLVIGEMPSGYIVTKHSPRLVQELTTRCEELQQEKAEQNWSSDHWINVVRKT